MNMNIKRLDILEVDLQGAVGSEQTNRRPCATHTLVKKSDAVGLRNDSTFLGEQPRTIDRRRILRKVGRIINSETANKVDKACYDAFFYQTD